MPLCMLYCVVFSTVYGMVFGMMYCMVYGMVYIVGVSEALFGTWLFLCMRVSIFLSSSA